MPSLGLRVSRVFDLQPADPVVLVHALLVLGDDAFKIPRTNLLEKTLPMLLDVLCVDDAFTPARVKQIVKAFFALNQRPAAKVVANLKRTQPNSGVPLVGISKEPIGVGTQPLLESVHGDAALAPGCAMHPRVVRSSLEVGGRSFA